MEHSMKEFFVFFVLIVTGVLAVWMVSTVWAAGIHMKEGQKAPDFELEDQNSQKVRMSDYTGKNWIVLYFYPKDDTPGCTKEACSFRDNLNQLQALNAAVLGVSVDDSRSHQKFYEKFNLNFPILSDREYRVCQLYGTLNHFMGIKLARRSTFLIDLEGIIRKVFPRVQPKDHAVEVAHTLSEFQSIPR
jgi:thioredoxin-dependent peroxiredoxin